METFDNSSIITFCRDVGILGMITGGQAFKKREKKQDGNESNLHFPDLLDIALKYIWRRCKGDEG